MNLTKSHRSEALTTPDPDIVIVETAKSTTGFLSAVWEWIKQHWLVIVLGLLLLGGGYKLTMNGQTMSALLESQRQQLLDSHHQIEELESAVTRERAAREELQRAFDERINEIDTRYAREIEDIRRMRARRIRELTNNPEELDRQLDERFGLAH